MMNKCIISYLFTCTVNSTVFLLAEFLAWLQIIEDEVVFVSGPPFSEKMNGIIESIKYQFTGDSAVQGQKDEDTKDEDDCLDKNCDVLRLFKIDLR